MELAYEAAMKAGAETKPYVFERIAVTRATLGDFGAAEEMIARIDDPSKVWPLWNVTEMLIRGVREAEAISRAENQFAPWPKAYALLGVATALINKQREGAHYYLNSSPSSALPPELPPCRAAHKSRKNDRRDGLRTAEPPCFNSYYSQDNSAGTFCLSDKEKIPSVKWLPDSIGGRKHGTSGST